MSRFAKTYTLSACAIAAVALLSACGGGDAGAPIGSTASTGYAVDGYLKDASVKCDASGIVVRTDSAGFFRFPDGCSLALTLTGGINQDTLLPFAGTLKAPAGSKMVTPLTTLQVGGMTQDQVNASLSLPAGTDLSNTDPALRSAGTLVHADLLKKTLALQQLMMQTTEAMAAFAGDSSDAARQAIYAEVASAFAAGLKGGAKLNATATTVDLVVLKALVTAAGNRLAFSALVPPAVKAAFAPAMVTTETFAAVISGGMKAQAEVLLTMADANVTTVTIAQQTDTKVKTAVIATGMSAIFKLASTDAAVVAKATALTDAVNAANGGGGSTVTGLPLTFDAGGATSTLTDFGGNASSLVAGPTGGNGTAVQVTKGIVGTPSETWAGTTVVTGTIPFTSTAKSMTVRVWAPAAGIPVRLKVEDASNAGISVETEASTTASGWQTLTFNFANQATGTAAINIANTYNKASIFFNFGTAGTGQTYYFDDVAFVASSSGGGTGTGTAGLPLTFDAGGATSTLTDFGGNASSKVTGPAGGNGTAVQVIKGIVGTPSETWAGTTVVTGTIPFTSTAKSMTVLVWAPAAGIPVRLKVEDASNAGISVETEASTTASGWQTLTFNFANQATGTAAINIANTYNKASIFFNFGTAGTGQTYYFDDVAFVAGSSGGGTGTGTAGLPLTFDAGGATSTLTDFGGNASSLVAGPTGSNGTAVQVIKGIVGTPSETWAGTTVVTGTIPFTSTAKSMTVRVWSPTAGIPVRLKVEDASNAGISVETEATTTVANGWQSLTFNFANQANGTAAINIANTYNKASIFFNFGTVGTGQTYYFDDVAFVASSSGGGSGGGAALTGPINFEAGGRGAAFTWFAFDNFSVQPVVVSNPSASGINTSSMVLKFSQANGAWYTGMESKHGVGGTGSDLGTTVMSTANGIIKMKVYKTLISDVGVKLVDEGNGSQGDVRVANTLINQWEELTFNYCGKLGTSPIDQIVVFPDFNALDVNHTNTSVSYVDDIVFSACP